MHYRDMRIIQFRIIRRPRLHQRRTSLQKTNSISESKKLIPGLRLQPQIQVTSNYCALQKPSLPNSDPRFMALRFSEIRIFHPITIPTFGCYGNTGYSIGNGIEGE